MTVAAMIIVHLPLRRKGSQAIKAAKNEKRTRREERVEEKKSEVKKLVNSAQNRAKTVQPLKCRELVFHRVGEQFHCESKSTRIYKAQAVELCLIV